MGDVTVLLDPVQYSQYLVALLRGASTEVYYSSFTAHLHVPLPGCHDITLASLLNEAGERGVAVYLLYNPEPAYGNATMEEVAQTLPYATVKAVCGSGKLPKVASLLVNNVSYSNHHQKYVCVDKRVFMLGGTDVTAERGGWLIPNKYGYVWHEIALALPCTRAMAHFCALNFDRVVNNPPYPLTKGYQEYMVVTRLLDTARTCVHMEAQTCISTAGTENNIFTLLARRLWRAYQEGRPFYFMLLTNLQQQDESRVVSWVAGQQLLASLNHLYNQCRALNLPDTFVHNSIFVGFMMHEQMHIKVHSNLLIQDGRRLLRSSSNFNDRSWSCKPSDNELGVVVQGEIVARTQQQLWRQYFQVPAGIASLFTPEQAFGLMCAQQGVVRRVERGGSAVVRAALSVLGKAPWFGGKVDIQWVHSPPAAV